MVLPFHLDGLTTATAKVNYIKAEVQFPRRFGNFSRKDFGSHLRFFGFTVGFYSGVACGRGADLRGGAMMGLVKKLICVRIAVSKYSICDKIDCPHY